MIGSGGRIHVVVKPVRPVFPEGIRHVSFFVFLLPSQPLYHPLRIFLPSLGDPEQFTGHQATHFLFARRIRATDRFPYEVRQELPAQREPS